MSLLLDASNKLGLLPEEETRELIRKAQAGDRAAAGRIITANMKFVMKIAMGYARRYDGEVDDLAAAGAEAMLKAIEKFDPSKDVRFLTYAGWWIRQGIDRYIDNDATVRVPAHVQVGSNKLRKRSESFDAPLGDEIDATLLSVTASDTPTPEALAMAKDTLESGAAHVQAAMHKLNEQQKFVLRERYLGAETQTLEQVAQKIGKTRERVRQIETKAFLRLRKLLPGKEDALALVTQNHFAERIEPNVWEIERQNKRRAIEEKKNHPPVPRREFAARAALVGRRRRDANAQGHAKAPKGGATAPKNAPLSSLVLPKRPPGASPIASQQPDTPTLPPAPPPAAPRAPARSAPMLAASASLPPAAPPAKKRRPRQLRILRRLIQSPATLAQLALESGKTAPNEREALVIMQRYGLVERTGKDAYAATPLGRTEAAAAIEPGSRFSVLYVGRIEKMALRLLSEKPRTASDLSACSRGGPRYWERHCQSLERKKLVRVNARGEWEITDTGLVVMKRHTSPWPEERPETQQNDAAEAEAEDPMMHKAWIGHVQYQVLKWISEDTTSAVVIAEKMGIPWSRVAYCLSAMKRRDLVTGDEATDVWRLTSDGVDALREHRWMEEEDEEKEDAPVVTPKPQPRAALPAPSAAPKARDESAVAPKPADDLLDRGQQLLAQQRALREELLEERSRLVERLARVDSVLATLGPASVPDESPAFAPTVVKNTTPTKSFAVADAAGALQRKILKAMRADRSVPATVSILVMMIYGVDNMRNRRAVRAALQALQEREYIVGLGRDSFLVNTSPASTARAR